MVRFVAVAACVLSLAVPLGADYRISVWVPPWDDAALTSMQANAAHVTESNPVWYSLSSTGSIVTNYNAENPTWRAAMSGTELLPTIQNYVNGGFNGALVASIVNDPVRRESHAEDITQLVLAKAYDGIDIDYEAMPASARAGFTQFVNVLAAKLHTAGKKLSVTVHAKTSDAGTWDGPASQDWVAIGLVADTVKIMAYDYHWSTSAAGPITPLDWLDQVVTYARSAIAPPKVIVGLPWYGYDWVGTTGTTITYRQGMNNAAANNVPVTHDANGEATYSYSNHQAFFQDAYSYDRKVDIVVQKHADVGGFAHWSMGQEDPAIWTRVAALKGTGAPPPPPPTPPSSPTGLTASSASSSSITLAWTDNASTESGYRIERCTGTASACDASPASWTQIAQTAANAINYSDDGRTASTTYSYRVRAFNSAGDSGYSNNATATTTVAVASPTLIATGSTWRYLDNGSDQGSAWRTSAFSDATWAAGAAQLGYGDGDERTVVSYGSNSSNKHVTTYFRHTFVVADASAYSSLTLRLLRDDGAVVYLNGTEIARSNMPTGTIGYRTMAASTTGEETLFIESSVDARWLVTGSNVVAVEVHQADPTSSDISFDLALVTGNSNPSTPPPPPPPPASTSITRGPYLQMGTPGSVRVRWRTASASDSRVRYGTALGALNLVADDPLVSTEHEVVLSGLAASATYYYSVGSSTQVMAGNDAEHSFVTAPPAGTPARSRIWILGDSGTADSNAAAVRDAYYSYSAGTPTSLWLMLGDNAYNNGTDSEYQAAVFNMYPGMLRKSVLWPTLGNHDTAQTESAPLTLPYFQMFSLPAGGEAGGLASGTEKYYSFDYANIHFVCLDSMSSDRSSLGAMLTWLRNDLASTRQQWIIAFWHHPPYSKGSHDSDTETPLIEMRQNALPILEDFGVDLVLSGHSHSYERSYLIDGHYGHSSSLITSMKRDAGSGRDPAPYRKSSTGTHEGAVYAVAGSSGKAYGGTLDHPAMFISLRNLGSMILDVDGNRLDGKFLRETGEVGDSFTIIKGPPPAPTNLSATAVSSTQVDLRWTDASGNESGFRVERCTGTNLTCTADAFLGVAQLGTNVTAWSDQSVAASATFTYRVRAFTATENSAWSNNAEATTPAAPTLPAAPSALTAMAASSTRVDLTWIDGSTNEDGFRIERCIGDAASCNAAPAGYAHLGSLGVNAVAYSDTSAAGSTTYSYRVRAFNAAGDSGYSNTAAATTPAPVPLPPAAPSALTATTASATQVTLRWTDNSADEQGFFVDRCTGTSAACGTAGFSQIAQPAANTTTFTDIGLTAGTTYSYRVRSYNAGGDSAPSNTATATTSLPPGSTTVLVPTGSVWKYMDDGSDRGTGWRTLGYDDGAWFSGAGQLGYGDGDETTVVRSGSKKGKHITTYFRRAFTVADRAAVSSLTLRLLRDDGAVVYLNGTEVWRSNMPSGTIGYTTRASTTLNEPAENTFITQTINSSLLENGNNVIAVEIHQSDPSSSDISFDLELNAK